MAGTHVLQRLGKMARLSRADGLPTETFSGHQQVEATGPLLTTQVEPTGSLQTAAEGHGESYHQH
jgi:hypothetical protein